MLNLAAIETEIKEEWNIISGDLKFLDKVLNSAIDLMAKELEPFKKYGCEPKFTLEYKSRCGRAQDTYHLSLQLENRSFTLVGLFQHYWSDPKKVNLTINGDYCGLLDLTADNIVKHFLNPDVISDENPPDLEGEFADLVWEHFRKN